MLRVMCAPLQLADMTQHCESWLWALHGVVRRKHRLTGPLLSVMVALWAAWWCWALCT